MFGIYTQFGLSTTGNYSYNKNCTIAFFIKLINVRANFAIIVVPPLYGPLVGALDVSEPNDFSLHKHENGGTGSSKLDKITSPYFYRGRRLSP